MRIFVALPLAEDAASALDQIAQTLPAGDPVPEENWHITLAFAADVAEDTVEEFGLNLSGIAVPRFAWQIDGFGVFGAAKPRQIHAQVAENSALTELHHQVRRAARNAGLILRHRRFVPHVTISRLRRAPLDIRAADWLASNATRRLGPFVAREFTLFESELYPDGPRYNPLLTLSLL